MASSTPETPSDSSVMAVISERFSWVRFCSCLRRAPTLSWITMKTGMMIRLMIVSCQLSSTIDTKAAITVTTFCRIEDAVEVRTLRTPETSLASRDWMSPVLVEVKKASSIFSRCSNRATRSSAIAALPTRLVR